MWKDRERYLEENQGNQEACLAETSGLAAQVQIGHLDRAPLCAGHKSRLQTIEA